VVKGCAPAVLCPFKVRAYARLSNLFAWALWLTCFCAEPLRRRPPWARPHKVMALSGMHVRKVACGSGHTVATTAAGQVYVWGVGQNGVLGCGGAADDGAPTAWDLPRQLSQQQRRASTPLWEIHCGDVYFDVACGPWCVLFCILLMPVASVVRSDCCNPQAHARYDGVYGAWC